MDQNNTIKAMDEFSERFGMKPSSIGQQAAGNRKAYESIKAGRAFRATEERILAWIARETAIRSAGVSQ